MFKRTATAGLIPALIVSGMLMVAFMAPAGASSIKAVTASCGTYPSTRATAWLDASPLSLSNEGSAVTLTARSTGCPNPEYKFFLQSPGGHWLEARTYGGAVFVWNTTGARDGVWGIGVWVRNIGSGHSYDAYFIGSHRILANCIAAELVPTPASPAARGTLVSLQGFSTLCSHPVYRFWVLTRHGTHWSSFGPYSAITTKNWNTTGYPKGPNRIGVWVRQVGSTHTYDTYSIKTFYIT